MADTDTETTEETTEVEGTTDDTAQAEIEKWKALARKHEGRAKENADAAKRLKELEDEGKSDLERLQAQLAEATTRADKAEAKSLRLEVAAAKGLTPAQAKRLVGATAEELEADADELLSSFSTDTGGDGDAGSGGASGRPQERLRSGASNDAEPEENDPIKLAEMIPRP